ncbi:hypothetical protein CTM83_20245 [Photobacterium leiognathi subsp. mandapamensis]|nr:hypothetical protein CTM83_20245 [Photobacterium leiognathi subsp. mandapamensis]
MFSEISKIDGSKKNQSQKTQSYRRAADKVVRALYGKRAKNKANAITLNTASKYLTKVRNQVTKRGWLHHSYEQTVNRLNGRYPLCVHLLSPLEGQELETTRLRVKALKDKLLQVDRLEKALHGIDPNSAKYASSINELSKSFVDWKDEILRLKPVNKDERIEHINDLYTMFGECRELYNDLGGLKIDHEVMRWLIKDDFAAAEGAETSASALSAKKGQTIDIDYPTIMSRCEFLLSPVNLSVWKWEALAVGIALATGRRAIEVLIQGEFTKTGKYSLKFSGQAKERTGIDRENEFEIYSLIEADKVLSAIEILRSYPNIQAMFKELSEGRHYQFNELVHNRTATHLNNFMRDMMRGAEMETGIGRDWVFKDTRAIYAAICFKLFFDTDKRWNNVDQDMFFQTLLGHSDPKAQAHYKQFKIKRAGSKWDSIVADKKDRLTELERFDRHDDIVNSSRGSMLKMHNNVKSLIKQDPNVKITQRIIKDNFGGNYATIKKYLAIVDEALSFETTLETILSKDVQTEPSEACVSVSKKDTSKSSNTKEKNKQQAEKAQPSPEKPKFKILNQDENNWLVEMLYDNKQYNLNVPAANNMEAMKNAWQQYELYSDLPEVPNVQMTQKDGWWIARIMHKGMIVAESMGPGKQEEHKRSVLVSYQNIYNQFK